MNEKRNFYILGTDTDIGKTYISTLLYQGLKTWGCQYYKPIQSGSENGLAPDIKFLCDFNKTSYNHEMGTYLFELPISPHLASEIYGVPIEKNIILSKIKNNRKNYNFNIIEGVGGVYVPLIRNKYYNYNLIKEANLEVILVCSTKVGTINHTMLTLEFLKAKNIKIWGIIFNRCTDKFYEIDNIKTILEESRIKNYMIINENQTTISKNNIYNFFKNSSEK